MFSDIDNFIIIEINEILDPSLKYILRYSFLDNFIYLHICLLETIETYISILSYIHAMLCENNYELVYSNYIYKCKNSQLIYSLKNIYGCDIRKLIIGVHTS